MASEEIQIKEELDDTIFEEDLKSCSSSPLEDTLANDPDICGICMNKLLHPRILSCLHVFCEHCLNNKLMDEAGDAPRTNGVIVCYTCKQETTIGTKTLASLPLDVINTNVIDVSNMSNLTCTCCTTKEVAVSRCCTCHNLLCANCNSAHQYMRCFENHKVIMLEDLKVSGKLISIHKPIMCDIHTSENLSCYCTTCQQLICNECVNQDHRPPLHRCDSINETEVRVKQELETLLTDARAKVVALNQNSIDLDGGLGELAHQRSTARDLINESYQSYKAVLERCRDEALSDLNALHHERELKLMDITHRVDKDVSLIEDACKFTSRLLENGNALEILYLKKCVSNQLSKLTDESLIEEPTFSIEFETDLPKFERIIKSVFGRFITETAPPQPPPPPPQAENTSGSSSSSSNNNNNNIINNNDENNVVAVSNGSSNSSSSSSSSSSINSNSNSNLNLNLNSGECKLSTAQESNAAALAAVMQQMPLSINGTNGLALTNGGGCSSLNNSSPISLPTSMQSSFDGGEIQSGLPGFVLNPDSPTSVTSVTTNGGIQGFSSIAEYNIQQLASLAEKVDLTDTVIGIGTPAGHNSASHPSTATSPTPSSFTIADLLSGDPNTVNTAYHNLQALAKLGLNSTDATNGTGIVLGRGTSPGLDSTLTLSNTMLNGFSSMSNSTSPILSTPEDILPSDSLHSVVSGGVNNTAQINSTIVRTNKVSPMQIRCKFGQLGPSKGQFNSPHGFCLGIEEDIIVADTNNHRIQVFEKTGSYKFQFGIPGKDEGQLWYPRKVAVMRMNGKYVVCDRGNERSRMQIFTKNGHFIKKIAIRYIDIVAGLAVTQQGEIVAVDSVSPTVFVISENGELLRWFDCSDYMREPSDIAIHGKEYYVCDFKGHNVVVFSEQGEFLRRIGCENITNFPNGIDISDAGDILIGDSHGNRFHVAVFSRDGSLVTEFECPYVKVSRCCGLKITSEGYVVTLAKNNHHVLVLNTLYIL